MADELDIEAMLEAPYRKVRPSVCSSLRSTLSQTLQLRPPPPISRHAFPIRAKSIHHSFGVGPVTPVDPWLSSSV